MSEETPTTNSITVVAAVIRDADRRVLLTKRPPGSHMGGLWEFPGGKIENAILAKFYDVYRDTREEWPVSTEVGAWGGAKFVRMIQRHMARKQKYPSEGPATGMPYKGIENLRPESKAAVTELPPDSSVAAPAG